MNDGGSEIALGEAIAEARRQAGFTQQELCQKLNISYSTLTKIERGAIKAPSVFTVGQIAELCGVSIESLIGIEPITARPLPQPTRELKTAKNGIEFVYFDINGCMVRFFQRAFTDIAHQTGTSPDVIEETFWHYNDAVCRGEMSLEDFNRVMAQRTKTTEINWLDIYLRNVEPVEAMRECTAWVARYFKFGLLSNTMPGSINAMLRGGLLPDLAYDCVIDSSEVKVIKPEAEIFRIAAERSGVESSRILLVDDSRTNIMSAERLGWHVLWFDDYRPDESVERIKATLEW